MTRSVRARRNRRAGAALAAAAAALTACASAAAISTPRPPTGPLSFSGSCSFSTSSIDFSPGLKFASVSHTDTLNATGSCGAAGTGHLTGTLTGPANCTGGQAPATGTGTLVVGSASIPVKIVMVVHLPNGQLTITGTGGGFATGSVNFLNGGNLGAMPGCVGAGLAHATFTSTVRTTSPLSGPAATKSKKRHR